MYKVKNALYITAEFCAICVLLIPGKYFQNIKNKMSMYSINVMLKPASSLCNMRCNIVFMRMKQKKRAIANYGLMSFDTLHSVLEKVLSEATRSCTIAFRGGEPTLAGLPFFRQAISICKGKM